MKMSLAKKWKYRAKDANGKWWFFENKPNLTMKRNRWEPGDEKFGSAKEYYHDSYSILFDIDMKFPEHVHWTASLQRRTKKDTFKFTV